MRLSIDARARQEFIDAALYYREASPTVAERFIRAVESALDEITLYPNRYPTERGKFRYRRLLKFPYSIKYQVKGDIVRVHAIAHAKRKPGYWNDRT